MRLFSAALFQRLRVLLSFLLMAGLAMAFQNCGSSFEATTFSSIGDLGTPNTPTPLLGLLVANTSTKQTAELKFQVTLQAAKPAPILVQYETIDGTALANADYLRVVGTITIAAGTTVGTIEVPTMNLNFNTNNKNLRLNVVASMGAVVETQSATGIIEVAHDLPKFKKISTGYQHACGITMNDSLTCWGRNSTGNLGADPQILPAGVFNLTTLVGVKDVQAGSAHTCVVTAQNTVKCWGDANSLGSSATANSFQPTEIPGLGQVKSLSTKSGRTCALTADDKVKCWGFRFSFEVSNGTPPEEVLGTAGAKSLSVGYSSACIVTAQDTVKCWGSNFYGELGNGNQISSLTAVDVVGLTAVKTVVVGGTSACAALISGTVKCWGLIGATIQNPNTTPIDVAGLSDIVDLKIGSDIACATNSLNLTRCWGANGFGILGGSGYIVAASPVALNGVANFKSLSLTGTYACLHSLDDSIKCWGAPPASAHYENYSRLVPTDVNVFGSFKTTDGGSQHSCALTAANTVKCWGNNNLGQLGNNSNVASNTPVDVVGLANVKEISVGGDQSCALTLSGEIKCWGANSGPSNGQTIEASLVPRDQGFINAKSINVGDFSLSCAVTSTDEVSCWGTNYPTPTLIPGLTSIKQVAVSGGFSGCAVTLTETVKCWGQNNFGQLGQGNTDPNATATPVDIIGVSNVKQVSYGTYHICALSRLGAVKCWGAGDFGQLGNNSSVVSSASPVDVVGIGNGSGAVEVFAGFYSTCATFVDQRVKCWGSNRWAEFGNGTQVDSKVPTEAFLGQKVSHLSLTRFGSQFIDSFARVRKTGTPLSDLFTPTPVFFPRL